MQQNLLGVQLSIAGLHTVASSRNELHRSVIVVSKADGPRASSTWQGVHLFRDTPRQFFFWRFAPFRLFFGGSVVAAHIWGARRGEGKRSGKRGEHSFKRA